MLVKLVILETVKTPAQFSGLVFHYIYIVQNKQIKLTDFGWNLEKLRNVLPVQVKCPVYMY